MGRGFAVIVGLFAGALALSAQQQPPPDVPRCPFKAPRDDCATFPKATYTPNPPFSERARKKKIQGTVLLKITVQPDGSVTDPQVVRGVEPGLDKNAIDTVRTWRFEPSVYEGKPIATTMNVEVDFHLY